MPQSLKELKPPPLLNPPGGRRSLWAEVDVQAERLMRLGLWKAESEGKWLELSAMAADMKTLGLDVSETVAKHSGRLRKHLGVEGYDAHQDSFVWMASNMKTLGFDVKWLVQPRDVRIVNTITYAIDHWNWGNLITLMRQAKHIGLDVEYMADKRTKAAMLERLRKEGEEGEWASYSSHAASLNSLGYLPDGETEPHRWEMLRDLESKRGVPWHSNITMQARGLYELGYLTQSPDEMQARPLPKLKRFRK